MIKKNILRAFITTFCIISGLLPGTAQEGTVKNITIHEAPAFPRGICEPSIVINPTNPGNVVAGSILDRYHYSMDSGKSWKSGQLRSSMGVWGDPCVIANEKGRIYYFHLSDPDGKNWGSKNFLDRIVCQESADGGKTWSDGSSIGRNRPKQQDKEWAAAHFAGGKLACSWTQFDKYGSEDPEDESHILFSYSNDGGENWSPAANLSSVPGNCLDDDGTNEGAVPAFGPRGEVYTAWGRDEKIWFNRSEDTGKTWLKKEIAIANQPGGWNFEIPGLQRANGMPVTCVDTSEGPFRGTIYVNWADQRNGEDNTDIFVAKSLDGGKSWSDPVRVNDETDNSHQFFTWMTIDPLTGYLYTVFYDRRGLEGNETDVYLAWSKDGGEIWVNEKISEESFTPKDMYFLGDYNNISAWNGMVRPVWTHVSSGGMMSIRTAIIQLE